jgi:hypothetical protein
MSIAQSVLMWRQWYLKLLMYGNQRIGSVSVATGKIESTKKGKTMLKAIAIAKATKFVIREVKKFDVNVSLDKATSKVIISIQRKK